MPHPVNDNMARMRNRLCEPFVVNSSWSALAARSCADDQRFETEIRWAGGGHPLRRTRIPTIDRIKEQRGASARAPIIEEALRFYIEAKQGT